jgi:gluconate 2-dehydrogenase gamma chain
MLHGFRRRGAKKGGEAGPFRSALSSIAVLKRRSLHKDVAVNDHDLPASDDGRVIDRRRLLKDASLLTGGAVAATVVGPSLASASAIKTRSVIIPLHQTYATPAASPQATPVPAPAATPIDLETYSPVNLTADELTTLKAVLDRLIPKDDLGPGANEAGVFVYIDRALGGRAASSKPILKKGLGALDAAAGSGGFKGLSADKQDAMLTDAEKGKLSGAPKTFFATLLGHTREGMFCDPIHGGNVNFAGWDLMGYPGIKLVWTAEDQAVNSTPKPEHISVAQYGGTAS